jgi:exodeoxyribonuclease VII large subunit
MSIMEITDISCSEEIYTVSRLNREVRLVLEGSFPIFWIEGEISNFMAPQSGHWYFSLKDAHAQIRCAMFKPQNRRLTIIPKDGTHVLLKARVSLYEGRGDFQLLVENMEEAGIGKRQQAFEALKQQLAAKGWFATERKRKIPIIPKCIGVITSTTGAAIQDILHILQRRFAAVPVIIYPTLVQGELAAANIVNVLQIANRRQECDVLILARGGGSLEDLWPFNEEIVAHAIFKSNLPVVTGIGHEIDFTIADFVADLRAPTPSAASELVTPDKMELLASLTQKTAQLTRAINHQLHQSKQQLDWAIKQLQQQHPKRRLLEQAQQLDLIEINLIRLQQQLLTRLHTRLHAHHAQLMLKTPLYHIQAWQHQITLYHQKLHGLIAKSLQSHQEYLANAAATLNALSPLATLKRGFAIASTAKEQTVLHNTDQVKKGDEIQVQLHCGKLDCVVTTIHSE